MSDVQFDPFTRDFFDNPYDTYARLRDQAPCYHSEKWDFYAFSRFEDLVTIHRDTTNFTSTHGLTYEQLIDENFDVSMTRSMIMMDPPEHTRYRTLVSRAFTPRAMQGWETVIRGQICEYLDPLMDVDEFDMVADFAAPFPADIINGILGVPRQDRQQIRHWTDDMLRREEGEAVAGQAAAEAAINQAVYFLEFIADKRKNLSDDMTSDLIRAEIKTEDGDLVSLTDEEIAGFCSLLGAAGSETVTKLVGNATVLFHRFRDQWQKLIDDPTKVEGAVEEVLRYWAPSQYQGRMSVTEMQWHGVTVAAGKPVFLLTGAANHDEREYDNPDEFDIEREQRLALGLGHGIHACLGAALARLESKIALQELSSRWPNFVVDEGGLERVQMSNVAGYSKVPVSVR